MDKLVSAVFAVALALLALNWVWQHLGEILWAMLIYLGPIALPFLTHHGIRVFHRVSCVSPMQKALGNFDNMCDSLERFEPSPFTFMDVDLSEKARQLSESLNAEINQLEREKGRLQAIIQTHLGTLPSDEVVALWRQHNRDPDIFNMLLSRAGRAAGVYVS